MTGRAECNPGQALANAVWASFGRVKTIIAVEPFANLSKRNEMQWLANGLSELAGDYLTSARGAGILFGITGKFPPTSAAPDYIITGTYQASEETLKVFLRAYQPGRDEPVFVESFAISPPNTGLVFTGMERLIKHFLNERKIGFDKKALSRKASATSSWSAFESYINGLNAMRTFDPNKVDVAEIWFNDSIKNDPYYQYPYLALADIYGYLAIQSKSEGKPYQSYLGKLGMIETTRKKFEIRPPAVESGSPRVISVNLNPKVTNRHLKGNANYLAGLEAMKGGNLKAAKRQFEAAVELVPEDIIAQKNLYNVYTELGEQKKAEELYNRMYSQAICR